MEILKVVVDNIPKSCAPCPIRVMKICGREKTVRGTSGSAYKVWVPCRKCLLKEK